MNVLITGANGFIGRALTGHLLQPTPSIASGLQVNGAPLRLTLLDLAFDGPEIPGARRLIGSIGDASVVAQAFETPVDAVFHLASVPGGMAEQQYALGRRINLDAMVLLLEASRAQTLASGHKPAFVFASSIAVLGGTLPAVVDDATALRPSLSYGAQKLCGEILLEDFQRHGWLVGRAVRLPGIVARPPQRTGQLSAFMSDVIREPAAGRAYHCPIPSSSTTWLMSVPCVLGNLIHAATMSAEACAGRCVWTLPALHCSLGQLVEAIGQVYGAQATGRVSYGSNPALEANFGRYPPLRTPAAEAAGFAHDGDLTTLVRRALT